MAATEIIPVYSAGTVSVAKGERLLTFRGARGLKSIAMAGDFIKFDNGYGCFLAEIAEVHAVIPAWKWESLTDGRYEIHLSSPLREVLNKASISQ